MKTVCIPWKDEHSGSLRTGYAIEMSHWIKAHGLRVGLDYEWYFDTDQKETRFIFHNDAEMYATMFALRWIGT